MHIRFDWSDLQSQWNDFDGIPFDVATFVAMYRFYRHNRNRPHCDRSQQIQMDECVRIDRCGRITNVRKCRQCQGCEHSGNYHRFDNKYKQKASQQTMLFEMVWLLQMEWGKENKDLIGIMSHHRTGDANLQIHLLNMLSRSLMSNVS